MELLWFLEVFLHRLYPVVRKAIFQGKGGTTIGLVEGRRPEEDTETDMDQICEDLFRILLGQFCQDVLKRSIRVLSEHGDYIVGEGPLAYYCAIDPYDGSTILRLGFRAERWSVVTFYDLECQPICGGAVDLLSGIVYLGNVATKEVFVLSMDMDDPKYTPVVIPRVTALDKDTVLAAYLMSYRYRNAWDARMGPILDKARIDFTFANGGAASPAQMVDGAVHLYVMFEEPNTETNAGLGLGSAAGFAYTVIEEDGTRRPYRFDPDQVAGSVFCLIISSTPELGEALADALNI